MGEAVRWEGRGGCALTEAGSCLPSPEKGCSSGNDGHTGGEGATLAKVSVTGPPLPTQVVRKAIIQASEGAGMFWPLIGGGKQCSENPGEPLSC